ncbi:MAG TPA: flagellin lysine-N-methylase [Marinospirillum sp.]|uniref:flagellin lysine-N-methylase n=1 Tax=Marinospirillum sp. TaxID=2183934 RepID=UPI002B4AACA1|nr:flagellin lysine-N-methylase [Marinospirillum sp.]HKM16044.1 flagellin lysine-N-methylase [Marinospirillum sp.]
MKKKLLAPKYAREFVCTGPKCPEDCCAENWTVTIDAATYRLYQTDPKLSALVMPYLQPNKDSTTQAINPATIKPLPKVGGCPMQLASGLCSIHKQFGEGALSGTCAVYPRTYKPLGTDQLLSMADSCPEVTRALLNDPNAMQLEFGEVNVWDRMILSDETEFNTDYQERYQLLQGLLSILQYRQLSFEMRLFVCSLLIPRADQLLEQVNSESANPEPANPKQTVQQLLQHFYTLLDEGYFATQAKQLASKEPSALDLVILKDLMQEKNQKNAFAKLLAKTLLSLGVSSSTEINENTVTKLASLRLEWLTPFEDKHPHALENIFVNWLLQSIFPINSVKLADGWLNLTTRYLLLRTLLIGNATANKGLNLDTATYCIYRFGRNLSSSDQLKRLLLELVGKGQNQPAAFIRSLQL